MSLSNSKILKNPNKNDSNLPYDPSEFPRELKRHYISAGNDDISSMLEIIGLNSLDDLYSHIPKDLHFEESPNLPDELDYDEAIIKLSEIAHKTNHKISFIGDALHVWKSHKIVDFVSNLRSLSTSYTPYQPERSQGTLVTHWIYQCAMSTLTGFEAINTSLYDRTAAIYEAICCAVRTNKKGSKILLAETLFEKEVDVIRTLAEETSLTFDFIPVDPETGVLNYEILKNLKEHELSLISGFVFPQVNSMGLLEDVDLLADFCSSNQIRSIACIDPMLLGTGGLKPPTNFGEKGADFIVGEAQHLAIGANFGGPGLGLFGCRHNQTNTRDLRSSPGRYIGKAKDENGRDCFVMILSTREQHIRKEKATSNVCSNQAFLATLAGASLLAKGENGLSNSIKESLNFKSRIISAINNLNGIRIAFSNQQSFNEIVLETEISIPELLNHADALGIQLGVDVSNRYQNISNRNLIKLTFTDIHEEQSIDELIGFLNRTFELKEKPHTSQQDKLDSCYLRNESVNLPSFSFDELSQYYKKLAELNVSPDNGCYPLGSCTMKYNPLLNDWAASLSGFSNAHPQAPETDVQGPLEVLFEIQEWFKQITGLPGVTTQPVAGAQGELVGLKLFQAYHRSNGCLNRDVVFIPKSAHGTNFATAAMAGFTGQDGIVYLEANENGTVNMNDFHEKISLFGKRLCGVMITNPNTSGLFEESFHEISKCVHKAGGLVYMDGANMNAIAGKIDLGKLGVDAVHNNLHKTWTIPHGGGGPGDAIVAVSKKLIPFLPGFQIIKDASGEFNSVLPEKSIGSFHRHWGNFSHKVRAYSYLLRLGKVGVPKMSSVAVLASRYLFERLKSHFPTLPEKSEQTPRMHEFILTLSNEDFLRLEKIGIPKSKAIPQVGKLFLDFGFHAPTVAFPEIFGLMIEPTESYSKEELDRFADAVIAIKEIIIECPRAVKSAPHFTPIDRVDEVTANRNLILNEKLYHLPSLHMNRISPNILNELEISEIKNKIIECSNHEGNI